MILPLDDTLRRTRAKPAKALRAAAAKEVADAHKARRDADKRWDNAIDGGIKTGALPDYRSNPEPVGTNRVVYADAAVQLSLSVIAPIVGIEAVGLMAYLAKWKVEPKLLARAAKKFRTETRPAHKVTANQV